MGRHWPGVADGRWATPSRSGTLAVTVTKEQRLMAASIRRILAAGTLLALGAGPLAFQTRSDGPDPTSRAYTTSRFLTLHGVRTHVQVWEPADAEASATIIALHHFYGSAQTYDAVGRELADRGVRLVAFDRLGFGLSDRPDPQGRWTGPDAPYTRAFAGQQVLDLLDELGVDRAVVTGTSMGGTATLELALTAPERLAAIVPVASPLTADASLPPLLRPLLRTRWVSGVGALIVRRQSQGIGADRVGGAWLDPSRVTPADIEAHTNFLGLEGYDAGLWWKINSDVPPRLRDAMGPIRDAGVPVVAVVGDSDPLISVDVMRHVAEQTGGGLRVVHCGHIVHQECPLAFAELLAEVAAAHG